MPLARWRSFEYETLLQGDIVDEAWDGDRSENVRSDCCNLDLHMSDCSFIVRCDDVLDPFDLVCSPLCWFVTCRHLGSAGAVSGLGLMASFWHADFVQYHAST